VHEAELVLQIGTPVHHFSEKGYYFINLPVPVLFEAFEEGLLAYFDENRTPPSNEGS
jgi:hypothetical protein